jgi:rhamnosyltransferase
VATSPAGNPRISIVLPTRNGIDTLPAVLDAIDAQQAGEPFEVVAVDSESTDGTAELLERRVDRLVRTPAAGFNHGLTRNLAIQHARGQLIVLLVQDAVPASPSWLSSLTSPLREDPAVAGTFARQQPRPDASPVTRRYAERWVAASETPRTVSLTASELAALPPMERLLRCAFDNVCSCIRRSVWLDHPFRATPIAEDLEWARDVLLAGHRLAYVPAAVVVHSHDRAARHEFTRTYELHGRLYALFGLRTIPSLSALAAAVSSSLALHLRFQLAGRGSHRTTRGLGRALALAVAWPLGQYLGARAAARHAQHAGRGDS